MTGRVARRVMPLPTSESGSLAAGFESSDASAEILGCYGDEAAQHCKKSAYSGVERRISRSAGEIRNFERMCEYRHIPEIRQIQGAAYVIPVAVRKKNCFRARAGAVERFCRFPNRGRMARRGGVHQSPRSRGRANEINVRDTNLQAEDVWRDFIERHNNILGQDGVM